MNDKAFIMDIIIMNGWLMMVTATPKPLRVVVGLCLVALGAAAKLGWLQ